MSRGTGLLRVASQGLSSPFLKTFAAIIPDPTDRPWVSKDESSSETWRKSYVKQVLIVLFLLTMPACCSQSILQKTVSALVNQITSS